VVNPNPCFVSYIIGLIQGFGEEGAGGGARGTRARPTALRARRGGGGGGEGRAERVGPLAGVGGH